MSNLNADDGQEGYGTDHEHDPAGVPAGDSPRMEDGADPRRSDPSDSPSEPGGADVARVGDDWSADAPGDGSGGPGYQPELPGFHAAYAVSRVAPLPDPGEFAAYGHTVADAPERILRVMERNAEVNADAVERNSKAQATALKTFAFGYVLLPLAALVAGVIMAGMSVPGGMITAVLGGVGIVAEMVARAIGGRKRDSDDEPA